MPSAPSLSFRAHECFVCRISRSEEMAAATAHGDLKAAAEAEEMAAAAAGQEHLYAAAEAEKMR